MFCENFFIFLIGLCPIWFVCACVGQAAFLRGKEVRADGEGTEAAQKGLFREGKGVRKALRQSQELTDVEHSKRSSERNNGKLVKHFRLYVFAEPRAEEAVHVREAEGSNGVPVKLKEGNMVTVNGIRGREIVFVGNVRPEGVRNSSVGNSRFKLNLQATSVSKEDLLCS